MKSHYMDDHGHRIIIFLLTVVGIGIFFSVIMIKINAMAYQAKAELKMIEAEIAEDVYYEWVMRQKIEAWRDSFNQIR